MTVPATNLTPPRSFCRAFACPITNSVKGNIVKGRQIMITFAQLLKASEKVDANAILRSSHYKIGGTVDV
jgi:hypothetical protein